MKELKMKTRKSKSTQEQKIFSLLKHRTESRLKSFSKDQLQYGIKFNKA